MAWPIKVRMRYHLQLFTLTPWAWDMKNYLEEFSAGERLRRNMWFSECHYRFVMSIQGRIYWEEMNDEN
mgnify:CR=1 FL=1